MTYYNFSGPRRHIIESKEQALKLLAQHTNENGFELMPFIDYLQRAAATLHSRYENLCNGFPFDKDNTFTESYEAATDKREKTLFKKAAEKGFQECGQYEIDEKDSGLWVALQRDPRGWPLILKIDGREVRLGGRVFR